MYYKLYIQLLPQSSIAPHIVLNQYLLQPLQTLFLTYKAYKMNDTTEQYNNLLHIK